MGGQTGRGSSYGHFSHWHGQLSSVSGTNSPGTHSVMGGQSGGGFRNGHDGAAVGMPVVEMGVGAGVMGMQIVATPSSF